MIGIREEVSRVVEDMLLRCEVSFCAGDAALGAVMAPLFWSLFKRVVVPMSAVLNICRLGVVVKSTTSS
jgi:hypothetical protein